jgi:hypothetical protein
VGVREELSQLEPPPTLSPPWGQPVHRLVFQRSPGIARNAPKVHFDIQGLNDAIFFVVDVLATESSPLEPLPSLNAQYWERALSLSTDPSGYGPLLTPFDLLRDISDPEVGKWEGWRSARRALDHANVLPAHAEHFEPLSTINLTGTVCDSPSNMILRGTWDGADIVAPLAAPEDSEDLAREALLYKDQLAGLCGTSLGLLGPLGCRGHWSDAS